MRFTTYTCGAIKILSALFLTHLAVGVSSSSADQTFPPAASILHLAEGIRSGAIPVLRIYFFPYSRNTIVPLSPAHLRRSAFVDREVRIEGELQQRLLLALELTTLTPHDAPVDVRWGAVFLDRDGKEAHSIYLDGRKFDGTGRRGIVDTIPVTTNGALGMAFELAFPDFLLMPPDRRDTDSALEDVER